MNKNMAAKLSNLPGFESIWVIICPDVCSYFGLVCGVGVPAGHPEENVYVPWVPHTAHKHLTPGHPVGRTPPLPRQSPNKIAYVHVPFLSLRRVTSETF